MSSITAPLFAHVTGSDVFHVAVKEEDDGAIRNRCWFASCIQVLAHDEAIFNLSQEAVLLLDAMGADVARAVDHSREFSIGCRLAYLVQQARCKALVPSADHKLFINTLFDTLLDTGTQDMHSTQEFIGMYFRTRDALLRACARLVPSADTNMPHPTLVGGRDLHLESDLASPSLLSSSPEWIMVHRTQLLPVAYNPDRVRVGRSAVFEVVCTVQFQHAHFVVWAGGQMLDSHKTDTESPKPIGSDHVLNTASAYLFLRRLTL